jgi:hypothetical protein
MDTTSGSKEKEAIASSASKASTSSASVVLALVIIYILSGLFALIHSIFKGARTKWNAGRIVGVIIAFFFGPIYWLLYIMNAFKK